MIELMATLRITEAELALAATCLKTSGKVSSGIAKRAKLLPPVAGPKSRNSLAAAVRHIKRFPVAGVHRNRIYLIGDSELS